MRVLLAIALILGVSLSVYAQQKTEERKALEKQLFTPVPISPPGLDKTQFRQLTQERRTDLVHAHETLVQFFIGLEDLNAVNPLTLLDPKFGKQFKDRVELGRKLFGEETSVVLFGLSNFQFVNSQGIRLEFYVMIFSEGEMLVREGSFDLTKSGKEWKIASISGSREEGR